MLTLADAITAHGALGDHAAAGHVRRRAVDQPDARRDRGACWASTIDVYGLSEVMGPGVAYEFVGHKDGPQHLGRPLHPEMSTRSPARCCRRRAWRLVFSLTKGSDAGDPLPHRDLTRLLPGSGCAMRRIDKITGRSDDC